MKPIRLVLIPPHADLPAPFMVIAADGGVLQRGELAPHAADRPEAMRTVAVCPGADVSIRWLDLPAGGGAQLRAAAAWRLRDDLATTPDRVVTVVGPPVAPDAPRLVAVAGHRLLQAWSDYLEALGVRADAIVPDVLTLPEPEEEDILVAVRFGENMALRGRGFAATVQPDLADRVAGGRRVVAVEDRSEVERALAAAARSPAINLLDGGAREAGTGQAGWRRAVVLGLAALASPLLLTAASAMRDDLAARRLQEEAVEAIAAEAPELSREADPVLALRRRAASAPPAGGATAAAAALFEAVEAVEGAEIDAFIAAPEDGVKATVAHPGWSDMDEITRRMGEAGMAVTVEATVEDAGRIASDISIGARP